MATPATLVRARRGWSRQRKVSDRHMDLAGDLDGQLAQLRREAHPWDAEREQVRLAYMAGIVAVQAPQRRWQQYLDQDVAMVEGFGRPQLPTPPRAA